MIENRNTGELTGQYELDDLLPKEEGAGMAEGYDAEGHLLNDVMGETTSSGLRPPSPEGEGTGEAAEVSVAPISDSDRLSQLATEINAITEQTKGVVISAALMVGKRLVEAKSLCPAGRFGEWLEKSVNYSERKAQDMMRLYVEYGRDGAIPESIAALDYSKAVALLSAPAEEREALAEKATGEDLSVRRLNAEIARLKAEKAKAQMTIDDMEEKLDRQKDEIVRMDENQQEYDRAIVERDARIKAYTGKIEAVKELLRVAQAKAASAEASAEELRKLRAEAEERADKNDQRARDAVSRANKTAVDLSEARAKIAAMEEMAARTPEPEVRTVEVVPEAVTRELEDLRRQLAEAKRETTSSGAEAPPDARRLARAYGPPKGEGSGASAVEKFKWFYANQMKPAFTTALSLLREVAAEDKKAADMYAAALTKGCQQLMSQIGMNEK